MSHERALDENRVDQNEPCRLVIVDRSGLEVDAVEIVPPFGADIAKHLRDIIELALSASDHLDCSACGVWMRRRAAESDKRIHPRTEDAVCQRCWDAGYRWER